MITSDISLGNWLDIWMNTYIKPLRATNTAKSYEYALHHLPVSIKAIPLCELSGLELQATINIASATYPRQAQLLFAALRASMNRALRLRIISFSPMASCDMPSHHATHYDWLSLSALASYLQAAKSDRHYPLLLLMAALGLRRGEALGAQWCCISDDHTTFHVHRQLINDHLVPLKSISSDRVLPLPASIYAALIASAPADHSGLILPSCNPGSLARAHSRALVAANLPHIPLHGLRHSYASAALHDGASISIIQHLLGHSHFELTASTYAHVLPSDMRIASDGIASALSI